MGNLAANPLIEQFWPTVMTRARGIDNLGACLSQARHQFEIAWGLQTWEVPQSQVCAGESFQWFVAHLLAQLPRFRTVYNEAISRYRRLHHLRSASHPAPELAEDGPWLEAPLWIWTADDPRRRRLFARQDNRDLVLSDRQAMGSPAAAFRRRQRLDRGCQAAGVARRGREDPFAGAGHDALGAAGTRRSVHPRHRRRKYDEVTDLLMERFFGIEPPGFLVLSGTLYLPIEDHRVASKATRARSGRAALAKRGLEASRRFTTGERSGGSRRRPKTASTRFGTNCAR